MLLLQQHLIGCRRATFKVAKVGIKATTRVVTNFRTEGTKVVLNGGTRAREKDTRVAINGMTMAQRVAAVNQLQIMVKSLLANVNLHKNVHLPHPHRL